MKLCLELLSAIFILQYSTRAYEAPASHTGCYNSLRDRSHARLSCIRRYHNVRVLSASYVKGCQRYNNTNNVDQMCEDYKEVLNYFCEERQSCQLLPKCLLNKDQDVFVNIKFDCVAYIPEDDTTPRYSLCSAAPASPLSRFKLVNPNFPLYSAETSCGCRLTSLTNANITALTPLFEPSHDTFVRHPNRNNCYQTLRFWDKSLQYTLCASPLEHGIIDYRVDVELPAPSTSAANAYTNSTPSFTIQFNNENLTEFQSHYIIEIISTSPLTLKCDRQFRRSPGVEVTSRHPTRLPVATTRPFFASRTKDNTKYKVWEKTTRHMTLSSSISSPRSHDNNDAGGSSGEKSDLKSTTSSDLKRRTQTPLKQTVDKKFNWVIVVVVVALICAIACIIFIVMYMRKKSKRGDSPEDGLSVTMTLQEDNVSISRSSNPA